MAAFDERYTGVREMIRTVLGERFLGEENIDLKQLNSISDIDLKFLLTRWFFNQNRMGLGLATGLEAIRDINTPAFMRARGYSETDQRKYRENAESYFITVAKKIQNKPNISALEEVVCNLGVNLRHYKDIRNIFAHSLSNPKVLFLSMPVDILRGMYLEKEEEVLDFLRGVSDYEGFVRSPVGKLEPIHDANFEKYEDYFFIMEEEE